MKIKIKIKIKNYFPMKHSLNPIVFSRLLALCFCIVGGFSTSTYAAAVLSINSITFDDKLSDNNHSANPGDTLQYYLTIGNHGDAAATGVTIQVTSSDPYIHILTPSSISLGTLN